MKSAGRILVGCSGYSYPHWKGPFYPEDLPDSRQLEFYAERFATLEVNNTFYNLPSEKTIEEWRSRTPEGFVFAVKASRYATHMKKLKEPEATLENFLPVVRGLGDKLGPVLFQLPPRWRFNAGRLASFLQVLPADLRCVFEFRDESWINDESLALLREHGAAFCIYELAGYASPREATADFVYVRLHGPGDAYQGRYEAQALSGWAGAASAWSRQGKDVFVYFDNDQDGFAALNAGELRDMLAG
ncbi:MAG: DUF72 domain-containing protein [Desulfovibrionaceae bacterium]